LLDLFVVNYLSWDGTKEPDCKFNGKPEYCHPKFYKGTPSQLFLNKGNGVFVDVSEQAGIRANVGKGMGAAINDYDHDGLPDIFVTNDKLFNFLYHNKGNGRFEEVAFETGVALPEHGNLISGMGTDFRDINNDGYPDIAVAALQNETFPVFQNNRKGGFTEITARSGMTALSNPMSGYSVNIADFDNDGWKDIFISHDGKLDLVVTALSAPAEIWMNDSPGGNHWVDVSLQGTKSNRDGIGARIKVTAGGKSQFNEMTTASGYASSSAVPVHFGLAAAKVADEIEIRWPSGTVQVLKNVAADQILAVKEP